MQRLTPRDDRTAEFFRTLTIKPLEVAMNETTYQQVQALSRMTVGELRERYIDVFGEETRSHHKDFLRKRIAWRLQALAEGSLSERARRRAEEIANDADLRIRMLRDPIKPGLMEVRERSVSGRLQPQPKRFQAAASGNIARQGVPGPGHRGKGAGQGLRI